MGFSVELEYAADAVASAVESVANDRTIRGTKISTRDREMEIDGATFAASSSILPDVAPPDRAFYKVKRDAIAPMKFPGSNGSGTVAVRYVVAPLTSGRTRLLIDAVFFQESLQARYFSDGSVESAESAAILRLLRDHAAANNGGAPLPAVDASSAGLQSTLADLLTRLADARSAEQELEKQIEQLKFNTGGQIRSDGVLLKVLPYDHSAAVERLGKGELVVVLATAKYWYRVRTPHGKEGWVYYVFLGPLS